MSLKEAEIFFKETGHPVKGETLRKRLVKAGVRRERGSGGELFYPAADIFEQHRDWVDGLQAAN